MAKAMYSGRMERELRQEYREISAEMLKRFGDTLKPQIGGFKVVRHLFSPNEEAGLRSYLGTRNLRLEDAEITLTGALGHHLDPDGYERVSKSTRVVNSIDINRRNSQRPVLQMYVKFTQTSEATETAVLAAANRWSGRLFAVRDYSATDRLTYDGDRYVPAGHQGKEPLRTAETRKESGYFIEERLPRGSSIRQRGQGFDEATAKMFGEQLAEKTRQMIDCDVMFNYNLCGHTDVRVVEKANWEVPFILKTGSKQVPVLSLKQLHSELEANGLETVANHMSNGNHFANWVRDCLDDPALAKKLEEIKYDPGNPRATKEKLLRTLKENMYDVRFIGADSYIRLEADRDETIVDQLTGIVRTVIMNVRPDVRPTAWRAFEEAFTGPTPNVSELDTDVLRDYDDRCRWINSARDRLTGRKESRDPPAEVRWRDFFENANAMGPFIPSTPEQNTLDLLASSLEALGVKSSVGTPIAAYITHLRHTRVPDPRDIIFDHVAAEDKDTIIATDTAGNPVVRFIVTDSDKPPQKKRKLTVNDPKKTVYIE